MDHKAAIEAVLAGDHARFTDIVHHFDAPVRRIVRGKMRDPHAREEVVQEIWLRAYGQLAKLADVRRLEPWLGSIARNMKFFLAAICFLLMFASTTTAQQGKSDYVVLTGFRASDPYHEAAVALAKHHGTKHIHRFDPEKPGTILKTLRRIEPRFVAIVLRPEQIHVNNVRRILRMATRVDDDPFVDFAFGYITGATASDAVQFVANIVRAGRKKQPRVVGRAIVVGKNPSRVLEGNFQLGKLSMRERSLWFSSAGGVHSRDEEFLAENLKKLEGCGALMMGGHGMPWEIMAGPRSEDIDKLELFPAVAFNYACHTGVTRVYPEMKFQGSSYVRRLLEVDEKKSFALRMIAAGVTGYMAYVNPRPSGPELSIDFHRVLAGAPLGTARRNDYAKIVLGYLSWDEPGIVAPDIEDGEKVSQKDLDPVRHMMLDGATGGILYGDPAFQPYPTAEGVLPLEVDVVQKSGRLQVEMFVPGRWTGAWCADPFRKSVKNRPRMAQKVYGRVELPKAFSGKDTVRHVVIRKATRGGKKIECFAPVWAIEEDQGKRYLHLKANFDHPSPPSRGDIRVHFVASRKAPQGQSTGRKKQSVRTPR